MRLLLIEDNDRLALFLAKGLGAEGFAVDHVGSIEDAEAALATMRFDAILLDLGLPDGDGLDLLKRLRARNDATPILVTTARGELGDRVKGLDGGADDYLIKPFEIAELAARLRALLRRPGAVLGRDIELGNLRFDAENRTVTVGGETLALGRRETDLLEALIRRSGRAIARSALENAIYGLAGEVEPNALEVLVSRLRRRLAEAGASAQIHTLRGIGYLMADGDA
ncbi:MAG TPA: response regulator transcription factor [Hypericibacter adhaerens]|jgi:DNA-binding response OmpR family regulator|uniref:DNA-binding response regulator n=1 Tax=Hypericibacter adhaerens TaxID=2602016 RepID=A0A5J6N5V8_9PROT|nr:response regulator transcription factor [Hypericibacter adhaerens]QEX24794.1 DNA-binding response regulator [Hypericibacter adhaerens]HWA44378.1 response regulator transcription factor [Hypericibacter adhaerens]